MLANLSTSNSSNPVAIHFGGGRALAPSSAAVAAIVPAMLNVGALVHVGCAVGADAQIIQAALAAGAASQLHIFAIFGPGGAGAWGSSAIKTVQAAAAAGASVTWFAGGPQTLPLRARLMRRSVSALTSCAASLFFQPGPGSLAVAAQAAKRGQPVFCVTPAAPLPLAGQPGAWSLSSFAGMPAWRWVSAQKPLF